MRDVQVRGHSRARPGTAGRRVPAFSFLAAAADAWERSDPERVAAVAAEPVGRGAHEAARRLRRERAATAVEDACRALPPVEVARRVHEVLATTDADEHLLDALAASLTLNIPKDEEAHDGE